MSLALTSRGLRFVRQSRSAAGVVPLPNPQPPGDGSDALLATEAGDRIVTENGTPILLETA